MSEQEKLKDLQRRIEKAMRHLKEASKVIQKCLIEFEQPDPKLVELAKINNWIEKV